MSKDINGKGVRRMYKLSWSSGKHYNLFCECCVDKALKESYIENSREVSTGTCYLCDYERDEEIIVMEKAELIANEIREIERLMERITTSERDIMLDQLVLHRTERFDSLVKELNNPVDIIQRLQFPIEIDKKEINLLLRDQIINLEEKKDKLLDDLKKNPA